MAGNKTTVNQMGNGQYRTTVPKGVADSFDLGGKKLVWMVASGNAFRVEIVDE